MFAPTSTTRHSFLLSVLVMLVCAATFTACESSPQDKMREARSAIVTGNADLAEERLREVLEADPGSFEAKRLMASVHAVRKDYERAEEALLNLWEEEGLGGEGDFTDVQRQQRVLLRDQFNDLYRRWVDHLDPAQEPEKFEEVVLKGLERDGRNTRFNALLVDFYQERADRFVERNEKIRAAEELEKINNLRTFPDIRRAARERSENLRREAFTAQARERFEENLQPELMESNSYDPEKEQVRLTISQPVDRRLDPGSDEARQQARTMATRAIAPQVAQLAIALTHTSFEDVDLSALSLPEMSIEDENFRRGTYEMTTVIALSNLINVAFAYSEFERTRPEESPEEPAAEEGATGEDAESDGAADEGSENQDE